MSDSLIRELEKLERNARDNRIACETADKCGKKFVSVAEAAHLYKLVERLAQAVNIHVR